MTGNKTIFVQIAAYRDPELVPTVLDCIARAKFPKRLHFGICWQHGPKEDVSSLMALPQVKIIPLPYQESKGACFARAAASTLYGGEDFYLQLDSHHRFIDGWDDEVISMLEHLEQSGVEKPLLTSYPPAYDPKNDPAGRASGTVQIDFNHFSDSTVFHTGSSAIKDGDKRTRPIKARFFAAGFAFARASFLKEVPYDPNYYFQGEEMNLAFRAFSHGYDLFHPNKVLCWHYYLRKDEPKHWTDHAKKETLERRIDWEALNNSSIKRLRHFFSFNGYRYEDIAWGDFGRGTKRTLRDYERYCGIDFRLKRITADCLNKTEPTDDWKRPISDEEWEKRLLRMYEHTIEISGDFLHLDDYDFIYVGYDRDDGSNIYCMNIREESLTNLLTLSKNRSAIIPLQNNFFADQMPRKWVIWPHSRSKGWTQRIGGLIPRILY